MMKSYLYYKQLWVDVECSYIVLIFQNDSFGTGAIQARHAIKVVHSNGQIMTWWLLLHQDVGALIQEIKGYSLERNIVGIPKKLTVTWERDIRKNESTIWISAENKNVLKCQREPAAQL